MDLLQRTIALVAVLVVAATTWTTLPSASAQGDSGCYVPDVRGMRVGMARIELEWGNCSLGKIKHQHTKKRQRGYVIAQSLPPDTVAPAGRKVTITVGHR
jgi:beta-lactam-binding protein with PASTA domain